MTYDPTYVKQHPLSMVLQEQLQQYIVPDAQIAVALSGGADSLALTLLSAACYPQVVALTVDHRLRSESTEEAEQVKAKMAACNIPHVILPWHDAEIGSNMQARAREARYDLLLDYCIRHDIPYLLTAHTQNDQAETVLINLDRGSGIDGLSAIPTRTIRKGVMIFRPLLTVLRSTIEEFLHTQSHTWISDPSNEDATFKRIAVRQFLSQSDHPELLIKRLAATASHMQRARSALDYYVDQAMAECVTLHDENILSIKRQHFIALPEEIALRLLATLLMQQGGKIIRPRFHKLSALFAAICSNTQTATMTLHHCIIEIRAQEVKVSAEFLIY